MTAFGSRQSPNSAALASEPVRDRPIVDRHAAKPSRRARALVGLAIGILCGTISFAATLLPGFRNQDFHSWWLAARAILEGKDPYVTIWAGARRGFVYPLPA